MSEKGKLVPAPPTLAELSERLKVGEEPIVVAPGIAVRRTFEGDEAVVYGGYQGSVNVEAVVDSTKRALAAWPRKIGKIEIYAPERDPRDENGHTAADRARLARAEEKRARKRRRGLH